MTHPNPLDGYARESLETPTAQPAPEVIVTTVDQYGQEASGVAVSPTQVRRPWRTTVRSVFQFALALATLLPFIIGGVYQDADQAPYVVGQVLVVAGTITRVMALPQVETFLRTFLPFLSAAPKE